MVDERGVHPLSVEHVEGIRALSRELDVAGAAGMGVALSAEEAAEYVAAAVQASEEGKSHVFALTQGNDVLGICRLIGVRGVPRLIVAIGGPYRGKGNGLILVRHVLHFAFETLRVERVTASGACLVLVAQFGRVDGNGLTRVAWEAAGKKAAG